MKRIFLLIFILVLIGSGTSAQTKKGSTATPYSTLGWDAPVEYSQYYGLYIYRLLSNPGGWVNKQTVRIDSLFNELIVFTDTTQLNIQNDTLRISNYAAGQNSFSGTAQYDTTLVSGIDSLDVVVVSVRESIPTANDLLGVKVIAGKIIVMRPSSGTSGLKYNWYWIRKY